MQSPSEQPTTLLLVRHAQTVWNKEHRYAGSSEVALAPEAKAQIAELTEKLKSFSIQAIYSSPLSRCQITVAPAAQHFQVPIQIKEELKERNLGNWEGKSPEELLINHSDYHFPESAYNGDFRIVGAEPLDQLEARIRDFLHEIAKIHPGKTVLIATHAGIIWITQKRIVTNPPDKMIWPGNCSLHPIRAEAGHLILA